MYFIFTAGNVILSSYKLSLGGDTMEKNGHCECLIAEHIIGTGETACILHGEKPCCAADVLRFLIDRCTDRQAFLQDCAKIFDAYNK